MAPCRASGRLGVKAQELQSVGRLSCQGSWGGEGWGGGVQGINKRHPVLMVIDGRCRWTLACISTV
jgi:hypothetical protein